MQIIMLLGSESLLQFLLAVGVCFVLLSWMQAVAGRDTKEEISTRRTGTDPDPPSSTVQEEESSTTTSTKKDSAFIVPSHKIVQLFPDVNYMEAWSLLVKAGVQHPNKTHYGLHPHTEAAIQRVVDHLLAIHHCNEEIPTPLTHQQHQQQQEPSIECSICCEEYTIEQMVCCRDNGHLFCTSCVRHHAEELVFGAGRLGINHPQEPQVATELMCMAADCRSTFPDSCLQRALPEKVLERYGELQGSLCLAQAQLDDLCSCPKCGFQAVLSANEAIFYCPSDDCKHASCRHCKEPPHGSAPCPRVIPVTDKDKDKRRICTEEAMTAALVRRCNNPKCRKPIIKSEGCNKLMCACGWVMCNVCKTRIHGYNHFCQIFNCDHSSCNKCPLWKSTTDDDERAVEEARRKAETDPTTTTTAGVPSHVVAGAHLVAAQAERRRRRFGRRWFRRR